MDVNRCLAPRPSTAKNQSKDGINGSSGSTSTADDGSGDVVAVQELSVGLSPLAKRVQEQVRVVYVWVFWADASDQNAVLNLS